MKSLHTYFWSLLLLGSLAGCGSSDTGVTVVKETDAANFIGSWSSACTVVRDNDGDFDAVTYEFEFSENIFSYSLTTFVDEDCTSQVVGLGFSSTTRFEGSYRSVGQVNTSTGLTAIELALNKESGSTQLAGGEIIPTALSEFGLNTVPLLVFVDDSDVLFIDDIFLALPVNSMLNLDVPFVRQTNNNNLPFESITVSTPFDENEAIVDLPERYEITLKSTSGSSQAVDITPRGTQQFSVDSGQSCSWTATNRSNSQLIGSGVIEADTNSRVTVFGVPVVPDIGTRLTIDCAAVHPAVVLLEGNWTTGCFQFSGESNSQSSFLTLSIAGNTSVFEGRSFTDLDCTVPAVSPDTGDELVDRAEDTLEFPGETVPTSLGESPFINFTNGSFTRFSIFTITPDDRLFFGATSSSSEDNRPLTLDEFFYYERL